MEDDIQYLAELGLVKTHIHGSEYWVKGSIRFYQISTSSGTQWYICISDERTRIGDYTFVHAGELRATLKEKMHIVKSKIIKNIERELDGLSKVPKFAF